MLADGPLPAPQEGLLETLTTFEGARGQPALLPGVEQSLLIVVVTLHSSALQLLSLPERNLSLETPVDQVGQPGDLPCRLGFRVLYRRVPRLFEELAIAHADGFYMRLLTRFAKADVLILDDGGLTPLSEQQRHDVLETVEHRHGLRSTVVNPTIADAVLDHLHNAHKHTMKGPSRRKEKAPNA